MPKLGVNIDHVATLRQARGEWEPDPLEAVKICEDAGADSIVCHLREDRRHINDKDVKEIKKIVRTRLNLEMSINKGIVDIACRIRPDQATLVPEKRQELTTEGGLDVAKYFTRIKAVTKRLQNKGIEVNLFIDPVKKQIDASKQSGATMIELHTGRYAKAQTKQAQNKELKKIKAMTKYALNIGLVVNAGHGLKFDNTKQIAQIKGIEELNIGHSIVANSVFMGLSLAVKKMKKLCKG